MKSKSLFLVGLLGMLFVGCGENGATSNEPKSENEQIKEAYSEGVSGKPEYTIDVQPEPFREELKSKNIDDDNFILRKVELSTVLQNKECKMDVNKVQGDTATIFIACGGFMNGDSYMKKVDGVWKIPVRE